MGKEFGRDLEAGVLPGGDAFAALQRVGVPTVTEQDRTLRAALGTA